MSDKVVDPATVEVVKAVIFIDGLVCKRIIDVVVVRPLGERKSHDHRLQNFRTCVL